MNQLRWLFALVTCLVFVSVASAAETLAPVAPPTDWTGVAFAVGIAVAITLVGGFVLYIRRPGEQVGEQAVNRMLDLLHQAHATIQTQAAQKAPVVMHSFAMSAHAKENGMDKQILITLDEAGNLKSAVQMGGAPVPDPVVTDWRAETGFPKKKVINDVRYELVAPLNPAYKGPVTDYLIGGANNPDTYIGDPAGAAGLRSPAGYPLVSGKVLYEGNAFDDDAAVESWIAHTAGHDTAAQDWSAMEKLKGAP